MDVLADVTAWGWQGSAKTIKERMAYLLKHSPIPFDVTFKVSCPGVKPVKIEAHKHVLAVGSEVFFAMLYGPNAKDSRKKPVKITDIHPNAFRLMIKYLYADELVTSGLDIVLAFQTLKCAGKYGVPYLYNACRNWLTKDITGGLVTKEDVETSALEILQTALNPDFVDDKILDVLWHSIDAYAEIWISTPDENLQDIECDTIKAALSRNTLSVLDERLLYDFVVRWAQLQDTSEMDSMSLAELIAQFNGEIRYAQMDPAKFAAGPVANGVITQKEATEVAKFGPTEIKKAGQEPRIRIDAPTEMSIWIYVPAIIADLVVRTSQKLDPAITVCLIRHAWQFDEWEGSAWTTVCYLKDKFQAITMPYGKVVPRLYEKTMPRPKVTPKLLDALNAGREQTVRLGEGDVALEVELTEYVKAGSDKKCYRVDRLTCVLGSLPHGTFGSNAGNPVFYLGRIVCGMDGVALLKLLLEKGCNLEQSFSILWNERGLQRFANCDAIKEDGDESDDEMEAV